jgi:hypothetical protein
MIDIPMGNTYFPNPGSRFEFRFAAFFRPGNCCSGLFSPNFDFACFVLRRRGGNLDSLLAENED